jgi:hypothetical protein
MSRYGKLVLGYTRQVDRQAGDLAEKAPVLVCEAIPGLLPKCPLGATVISEDELKMAEQYPGGWRIETSVDESEIAQLPLQVQRDDEIPFPIQIDISDLIGMDGVPPRWPRISRGAVAEVVMQLDDDLRTGQQSTTSNRKLIEK